MIPETRSKIVERIDDLKEEIEELQRQKDKLQEVDDFADFIETHDLITNEIQRLQQELKEEKIRLNNTRKNDPEDISKEDGS